jgi:hypothetical protein
MPTRTLYVLTYLAITLSIGHHLDHVIRGGSAVGWPFSGEVNAFSYSLAIYPIIIVALILTRAGRIGPGAWAFISGGGALFVGIVHFGPVAGDPAAAILDAYRTAAFGWLAYAWLVALVAVLVITFAYETRLWLRERASS